MPRHVAVLDPVKDGLPQRGDQVRAASPSSTQRAAAASANAWPIQVSSLQSCSAVHRLGGSAASNSSRTCFGVRRCPTGDRVRSVSPAIGAQVGQRQRRWRPPTCPRSGPRGEGLGQTSSPGGCGLFHGDGNATQAVWLILDQTEFTSVMLGLARRWRRYGCEDGRVSSNRRSVIIVVVVVVLACRALVTGVIVARKRRISLAG